MLKLLWNVESASDGFWWNFFNLTKFYRTPSGTIGLITNLLDMMLLATSGWLQNANFKYFRRVRKTGAAGQGGLLVWSSNILAYILASPSYVSAWMSVIVASYIFSCIVYELWSFRFVTSCFKEQARSRLGQILCKIHAIDPLLSKVWYGSWTGVILQLSIQWITSFWSVHFLGFLLYFC